MKEPDGYVKYNIPLKGRNSPGSFQDILEAPSRYQRRTTSAIEREKKTRDLPYRPPRPTRRPQTRKTHPERTPRNISKCPHRSLATAPATLHQTAPDELLPTSP